MTEVRKTLSFFILFVGLGAGLPLLLSLSACGSTQLGVVEDASVTDAGVVLDAWVLVPPVADAAPGADAFEMESDATVAPPVTCSSCHGDSVSAAPPKALGGATETTDPGVGAHREHLAASGWHKDVECADCHLVPGDVLATGHIDTALPAELTWSARARADGVAADYSGGTCTVYCHGPSLISGGYNNEPIWTVVNGTQAFCGSCHGLPPDAPHPSSSACETCHGAVIGAGLVFVSPNLHIDGIVQVSSPHPVGWVTGSVHGSAFTSAGPDACVGCHGADLSGGSTGVSCQACHSDWQTNCTFCHGGLDNGTGAPPGGVDGELQSNFLAVGAHSSHVESTSTHTAWNCSRCHITPTSVFSSGHIDGDGRAEVLFDALNPGAVYDPATGTCSGTYCHGSTLSIGGGTTTTPTWNIVDGSQSQCTSCHGGAPPAPHISKSDCSQCHDTMVAGSSTLIADITRHVDGVVDSNAGCFDCHDIALGSRRPVVGAAGDFVKTSHHVSGSITESDCAVCHELSNHRNGIVVLKSVDTGAVVASLTADPMTSATEAVKLEEFCLACHDADGANGVAPFSDGVMPPVVDRLAWNATSHRAGAITCVGDGTGFGCHSNGHASAKVSLLSGPTSGGPIGDAMRQEEAFCYSCHNGSVAASDVESDFAQASHHAVNWVEQGGGSVVECRNCHNPHLAKPSARLIDPDTGAAWESPNFTDFCLRCHDGTPPPGVAFAPVSPGTGYDKSAYVGSSHDVALGTGPTGTGYGCMHCHDEHGSSNIATLKARYDTADSTIWSVVNYALCFSCHDPTKTIAPKSTANNAFENLHEEHVRKQKAPCYMCHDTHGSFDPAEAGLINMSQVIGNSAYDIQYVSGAASPSAMFEQVSSTRRQCSLRCHGKNHTPKKYNPLKATPVDTSNPLLCAACHP